MAFNTTISAILRGVWLIEKSYANSQMPLVMRVLNGEGSFSDKFQIEEAKDLTPTLFEFSSISSSQKVYSVSPNSDLSYLEDGSVAMINISGPLMKNGGMCSYGMLDIAQLVSKTGNANNISGIILNIDSPGGQAYGTSQLADTIKQVDKRKPVVAVINDGMAASAAMWIASAAREIYVTKKTDKVGSIGVYTTIADFNKHYQEYFKLPIFDVYAPQSIDKNKSYADAIAGNDAELKEDLSVLAQQFIDTISENRGDRLTNDSWNTGKMFYAKDAIKIGLIDGQKSFEEVVNRLNVLISETKSPTKKTTKNMAFEKSMAIANAESFAVVEGGFMLTEENLNAIESALATAESNAALVTELQVGVSGYDATIAEHNATIAERDATIMELQNQVAALGAETSGNGTVLEIAADLTPGAKKTRSYNDPNSAINKRADRRLARK